MAKSQRKLRWGIVGIVVIASAALALNADWIGYVQSWGGTNFKALGGGCVGWWIGRYVMGIDLSEMPAEQRPLAGLSMAILIIGFANALT